MENIIIKILDSFKHLCRDIMIYLLPGFIPLSYLIIYFRVYYDFSVFTLIPSNFILIIAFSIFSYIFGNILMSFSYIGIWVGNIFSKKENRSKNTNFEEIEKDITIYLRNRILYENYIERYNDISYFRLNLKYSFLMCFAFSIGNIFFPNTNSPLLKIIITLIFLLFFLLMWLSAKETYKSFKNRLEVIINMLNKNQKTNMELVIKFLDTEKTERVSVKQYNSGYLAILQLSIIKNDASHIKANYCEFRDESVEGLINQIIQYSNGKIENIQLNEQ